MCTFLKPVFFGIKLQVRAVITYAYVRFTFPIFLKFCNWCVTHYTFSYFSGNLTFAHASAVRDSNMDDEITYIYIYIYVYTYMEWKPIQPNRPNQPNPSPFISSYFHIHIISLYLHIFRCSDPPCSRWVGFPDCGVYWQGSNDHTRWCNYIGYNDEGINLACSLHEDDPRSSRQKGDRLFAIHRIGTH